MQGTIQKETKIAVLCGGMSSEAEVSRRSGKNWYEALLRLGYKNAKLVEVTENIAKDLEGLMSSAVCMNKEYTKKVLSSAGLPLIKSVLVSKGDNLYEKVKPLKYPMMVKPVSEGSSLGMAKVANADELVKAVFEASKYKQDIMIEEYLEGVSTTVGILEKDDKLVATEILEFRTHTEWYDYEAKYTKGMTEFIIPAELSDEMTQKVKDISIQAFKVCGCSGVSRVDFLITEDTPYILEVNTSPGMTDTSDLPAQAAAMGISYDELVEIILQSAGLNK